MNVDSHLLESLAAAGFKIQSVEANPSIVYALDTRFRIAYCNPSWDRFAFENRGENLAGEAVVGRNSLDGIPDFLRTFYASAYRTVLQRQEVWEHDYECSSPGKHRVFRMRVLPLGSDFLLVDNALTVEIPHAKESVDSPNHSQYIDANGLIVMCANCRRTQRLLAAGKRAWDWVPSYLVSTPVQVSHGICSPCLSFYYKMSLNS